MSILKGRYRAAIASFAFFSIVLFFLYFTSGGLQAYFTSDDVMNILHLHGYFTTPFYQVMLDVVKPLTSAYRPLGGLFYRTMYGLVGFNPLPFRYVCFFLMLVNLALAYRLLRTLSGSMEVALLGVLGLSYHAQMYELYYNTGTIYDILCYTFFVLALSQYARRRGKDLGWGAASLTGLLLLDLLALQAKEMAASLPLVLLLYEISYSRFRVEFSKNALGRAFRRLIPVFLTGFLTGALLLYRLLTPNLMSVNPLYQPTLSLGYYLRSCVRYHDLLFYKEDLFSPWSLLCLWTVMALVALMLRSKPMAFGLGFWLLSLIPVALIARRSGFVMYLPMLGLALYTGILVAHVRQAVVAWFRKYFRFAEQPPWRSTAFRLASQAVVFGLVMSALATAHAAGRASVMPNIHRFHKDTRTIISEIRQKHPTLTPAAKVLFLEDPYNADDWILVFSMRLMYDDPDIWVDRAKKPLLLRSYDYVFSYSDGRLVELPSGNAPCRVEITSPPGEVDDSSSDVCWKGSWIVGDFPLTRGGTVTYSNEVGAAAGITFEGSGLEYVYTKAFNRGMAEVIIDGVSQGVVDLYAPTVAWQTSTVFSGLQPGWHTAEVRVLHRSNPKAEDFYVDVDALVPR